MFISLPIVVLQKMQNSFKTRYIRTLAVFLLLFVLAGLSSCGHRARHPKAEKGVLDLRQWNFEQKGNLPLDGEWAFYWNDTTLGGSAPMPHYIKVPGFWNGTKLDGKALEGHGFACYHVKIKLSHQHPALSLKLPTISTAYLLKINGKALTSNGMVGTNESNSCPSYQPHIVSLRTDSSELDLQLQVSNFHHRLGGLWESILIGKEEQIVAKRTAMIGLELFLIGSILIMSLYHLGLFISRPKDLSPLYFGIFCFLIVFRIGVTGEYTANLLYPFPWKALVATEYLSFYLSVPIFCTFTRSLFPNEYSKWIHRFNYMFSIPLALIVLLCQPNFYSYTISYFQLFLVFSGIYTIYVLVLASLRKRSGAMVLLMGFVIFFAAAINDVLFQIGAINSMNLTSAGLFFFIINQAYLLSSRFSKAFQKNEELKDELTFINKNLERLVDERTLELKNQNDELHALNAEIIMQRDEIEQHNSEISEQKEQIEVKNKKILDSIHYAKRIQNALLPSSENINDLLPNSFVFYQPRDIVSGDFYYIKKIRNKLFFAVADCTGHGVPGAFMSLLGVALLNDIVDSRAISEPDKILEAMRIQIKSLLHQSNSHRGPDDGMELAFCVADLDKQELKYAGAGSPLFIIRNGDALEVKPDRMPIGVYPKEKPFTGHIVKLEKNDSIYLFTDGYLDQLGGPERKKFKRNKFKDLLLMIAHHEMDAQKQILADTMHQWMGDVHQTDDILVLGAKLN